MANPIIKIKRGTTAPLTTLQAGEFAIDQVNKNLYLGVEVAGNVTNEIVGGNGTFATHTDVATAVTNATGSLGTMSTQDADSVSITGGSLNNSVNALGITGADISGGTLDGAIDASTATITHGVFQTAVINSSTEITNSTIDNTPIGATTASTGAFTQLDVGVDITMSGSGLIDMNAGRITNLSAPVNANDSVRKTDLDSAISALGSVFHYVGEVSLATTPFDLSTLPDLSPGAYYRVDASGTYVDATYPDVNAKFGDAFVFTASNGFQKIDNVDVVVRGTTNEIVVTGDEEAGYTVSIDPVFSGRVTTAESDITDLETKTQNIDLALTTAGTTTINGILTSQELWVGPNSTDAVKLLNPVAGPASIEAPSGKELVIKNGAGNTAITLINTGSGKVNFAYDVSVAMILDAYLGSFGSMSVGGSASFGGGINVNIGNLVGNGTNEITDFVIDGGSF